MVAENWSFKYLESGNSRKYSKYCSVALTLAVSAEIICRLTSSWSAKTCSYKESFGDRDLSHSATSWDTGLEVMRFFELPSLVLPAMKQKRRHCDIFYETKTKNSKKLAKLFSIKYDIKESHAADSHTQWQLIIKSWPASIESLRPSWVIEGKPRCPKDPQGDSPGLLGSPLIVAIEWRRCSFNSPSLEGCTGHPSDSGALPSSE